MTEAAPPRIRPGWVTAIALLTWIGFVWGVVANLLIQSNLLPIPIATQQYMVRLTRLDWGILFVLSAMQLVAATLLWMLRRQALWWFMVSTFLEIINNARLLVTRGLADFYSSLGMVGAVMGGLSFVAGLLLPAAILAYVVTLYRRGALE